MDRKPKPLFQQNPLVYPIVASSTFRLKSAEEAYQLCEGQPGYLYSRWSNPTVDAAAESIRQMEGAEGTLLFPSGMAAISTSIMCFLKAGDHIVAPQPVYSGTLGILKTTFSKWGLEYTIVDGSSIEEYEKAIKENTKVLYGETPANPTMSILDLEAFGKLGLKYASRDMVTMVDSTFASPYIQQPIKYGIDVAIHSCTKYVGGHSDLTAGALSFKSRQIYERVYQEAKVLGFLALSPFDAFLINRGMKTLSLRMEKHSSNAMAIATFLENHPKVLTVNYSGLPSHPHHEMAKKQMRNFGGMVSFEVKGGKDAGKKVVEGTNVFTLAVSLGGVESLIEHPATMTHTDAFLSREDKKASRITDGLIRLSVGLEDAEELKADLAAALDNLDN